MRRALRSDRATVPEIAPLVHALYKRNAVGCCWHVVLDDGNVHDDHVAACVADLDRSHDDCVALAVPLTEASRTQRTKLSSQIWTWRDLLPPGRG